MPNSKKKVNKYKIISAVTIAIGIAALYLFTPLKEHLNVKNIIQLSDKVPQTASSFAGFVAAFAIAGSTLIPMPLMAFASSIVFPLWIAIPLSILGAAAASTTGYYLGRFIELETFGSWVKKHLTKVKKQLDGKGAWAILALRVAPTPPFTITSILSGSLKLNLPKYILASTLGILPLMLLVIFFGKEMLEALKKPSTMSISSLVAIVILYIVFKIAKKKVNKT